MRAFLTEWSQPRSWPNETDPNTPSFLERSHDFDRHRIETMSLGEFAKAGMILTVDSAALGERVIVASDDVALNGQVNELTTYRASELSQLVTMTVEQLQTVHALKKTFLGNIEFVCRRVAIEAYGLTCEGRQ